MGDLRESAVNAALGSMPKLKNGSGHDCLVRCRDIALAEALKSQHDSPLHLQSKCRENALAGTPKSFWAKGSATASQLLQFLLERWVGDMIDHCRAFEMKRGAS